MAISFFGVGTSWEPTSANDRAPSGTPSGVPEGALMIAMVVTSNSAAVVTSPAGEGWQNLHTTMQPITNTLRYEYLTWYHGSQGPTPLDSLMMTDNATLQAQWHEGYQQNGPNGSLASVWGQVPNTQPLASRAWLDL